MPTPKENLKENIKTPLLAMIDAALATPGVAVSKETQVDTTAGIIADAVDTFVDEEGFEPGSVTSVAITMPTEFSVSGSPITTAGTLSITKAVQNANKIFAGPTTGADAQPTFRFLVAADIPDISSTYLTVATATSTYSPIAGSTNIVTLGTIATGSWNATAIAWTKVNKTGAILGDFGGTLGASQFDDTSHGSRGGGTLHADVIASGNSGFMTGADKSKLDGIAAGAIANPMTTLGDIIYGGSSGVATRLIGNTTTTKKFLTQTGDGVNSAIPGWSVIVTGDLPVMARVGASTYSTIQHMQDLFHSAGWISGGGFTEADATHVDVAAGTGLVRATASAVAEGKYFDWPASTGLEVPTNSTRFIGVEYNAGSPQVVARTTQSWDYKTDFPLGVAVNDGTSLHLKADVFAVGDHAANMILREYQTMPLAFDERSGGLALGESGTRNVTLTAGAIWDRLTRYVISAIDTSLSGSFTAYYRNGAGGFTAVTAQTQWPNTQYDDGTGVLATLGASKYAVLWWYLETDGQIVMLYGRDQYSTLSAATAESPPPTIPDRLTYTGRLLGRFIFQKSEATTSEISSVMETTFSSSAVTNHANLSSLDYASAGHTGFQANHANLDAIAAGTWTGAASITTLGTITSGTWNAGSITSSGNIIGTGMRVGNNQYYSALDTVAGSHPILGINAANVLLVGDTNSIASIQFQPGTITSLTLASNGSATFTGPITAGNIIGTGMRVGNNQYYSALDTVAGSHPILGINAANVLLVGDTNSLASIQFQPGTTTTLTLGSSGAATFTGAIYAGAITGTGISTFANTTDASSTTVGGTVISGGLALAKKLYVGTSITLPTPADAGRTADSNTVSVYEEGHFTGTLTGCTTSPTVDIYYTRVGKNVTLRIPVITATSNTTACTITGLPASIRPSQNCTQWIYVVDNTTSYPGVIALGNSDTMTLYKNLTDGFTASGTKGLGAAMVVSYILN